MAITVEELVALQPGDVVRAISLEEYNRNKPLEHWGATMTQYCGRELTVRSVLWSSNPYYGNVRMYVAENGYYWLPEFIDCVVSRSSKMEAPSEEELIGLLMLGSEDSDDNKKNV